jgi:hypothetical protein
MGDWVWKGGSWLVVLHPATAFFLCLPLFMAGYVCMMGMWQCGNVAFG